MLFMYSILLNAQSIMNIYQSDGTVLQIPLNEIDSITYTVSNPGDFATLSTLPVLNVTASSAISGGYISDNGGTAVTQRGVVWSTSQSPTTANNYSNDGSGSGSFTSNLTGLNANTTYFVRAYATNSAGTVYGNEFSFTTIGGGGIVSTPGEGVTFDGYSYSSIVLGNGQEWMAENLRTTIYSNGDPIPNVVDITEWSNLSTGAWVHYNNDNQYEDPYGKLYNWYTVDDPRNICPSGWHVPTDMEWSSLMNYLGGESSAGGKMKSMGTQYWDSPNGGATNESGFSGLPGGNRWVNEPFNGIGFVGTWWSSTEAFTYRAWIYTLNANDAGLNRNYLNKPFGYSVRCLRD